MPPRCSTDSIIDDIERSKHKKNPWANSAQFIEFLHAPTCMHGGDERSDTEASSVLLHAQIEVGARDLVRFSSNL